jgi:hypothetical protein
VIASSVSEHQLWRVTNNCGNPIQSGLSQLGYTMPWSLLPSSVATELEQLPIAIAETFHPKRRR